MLVPPKGRMNLAVLATQVAAASALAASPPAIALPQGGAALKVHGVRMALEPDVVPSWPEVMIHDPEPATHLRDLVDPGNARVPFRHPFWHLEWSLVSGHQVWVCCGVLLLAGILCAAGGIGGGGIYVTVLMVAGGLDVIDAVPLSKAVVFCGSVASLALNIRKPFSQGLTSKTLIDYNVCRMVVPSALLGTFLGVLLNRVLPARGVLLLLTLILFQMFTMVLHNTWKQFLASRDLDDVPFAGTGPSFDHRTLGGGQFKSENDIHALDSEAPPKLSLRNRLTAADIALAMSTMTVVVMSSVLRFHARRCQLSSPEEALQACNPPELFFLGHGTLQAWVSNARSSAFLEFFGLAAPLGYCSLVLLYYTHLLVSFEGLRYSEKVKYTTMSALTGCLAGLVGIGGGLVFSPFFLLMGVEPAIAVATSSTCVFFTSLSTTLQYLLTARVIMSLSIMYGAVTVLASLLGTSLVHLLQDRAGQSRIYISVIVGVGVCISLVLCCLKLVSPDHPPQ